MRKFSFFLASKYLFDVRWQWFGNSPIFEVLPHDAGFSRFTFITKDVDLSGDARTYSRNVNAAVVAIVRNFYYGYPCKYSYHVVDTSVKRFITFVK